MGNQKKSPEERKPTVMVVSLSTCGSPASAPREAGSRVDAGIDAEADTPRVAPNVLSQPDRSHVAGDAPSVAAEDPRADPQTPVAATPAHASAAVATAAIARAEFLGVTEKNLDEEDVEASAASHASPTMTRVSAPRSGEASILAAAMRERRRARWCGRKRRFHIGCVLVGGWVPHRREKPKNAKTISIRWTSSASAALRFRR